MKAGKKLSEKLLCDVGLPLTELYVYFVDLFASVISVESEQIFRNPLKTLGPKEISCQNKEKEAF